MYCQAGTNYSLTIQDMSVVLALDDRGDELRVLLKVKKLSFFFPDCRCNYFSSLLIRVFSMQVKSACLGLYLAGFNVLPILVVWYEEGKIVYPQVWEV